jgi:glycerol-3-phosphate acyltransferase PlsX
MTIVLDGMGSDKYPDPEIAGALSAAAELLEEIIIVGQKDLLEPKLTIANTQGLPVRVVHAPDVLEMGEKAVESARKKPNNSMAIGLDLVKSGEARAFVTAGNTGAAMFNGLRKLGRIKGVQRPALTAIFPVMTGYTVVLDIGANADCRPEFLQQFAVMGSIYAQKALNLENPRVGLLSNGEEAGKGNTLVKETYHLLENIGINFIGNVEAKELFAGQADVVVTDGFTGNVLLKTSESVAKMLLTVLINELMASTRTKIGAALAKPAFGKVKKMLDPSEVGAAPLLGIDGLVFVGHGRSDALAIHSALRAAKKAADNHLLEALRDNIQNRFEANFSNE